MKMQPRLSFFRSRYLFILLSAFGCLQNTEHDEQSDQSRVTIHTEDKKQTIRNFGASDAWTIQFVGQWPDEKRNQVADWLFSAEMDGTGKPKGIGLSLWRFNIGAGSAGRGYITDEWRTTEGFLNDDMSYDWSRQSGQRWFMAAAKARGVNEFLGFTNSPPVQLTLNGKAFSDDGSTANLPEENYLAFSRFLVSVAGHFAAEGIPFTYLSPFNEPQWEWTGNGQEGSPYTNHEMFLIAKKLDSLVTLDDLDLKLQVAEAGKLNYLYEDADKPARGDQVSTFFSNKSPTFIGDLPNVDKVISGHSYFTTTPEQTLVNVRKEVAGSVVKASVPIEFWQSEYCILGGQEEVTAEGKDTGIDPALYVARVIHHDLTIANASAWHWWLAVSAYDYKDGLIYVDKDKANGTVEDTKLLWAVGNYSRFIRPGSQRLGISASGLSTDDPRGLMISSYLNSDENKIISVIINYSYHDSALTINTKDNTVRQWKPYITGKHDNEKLKPLPVVNGSEELTVPARSIVTLVEEE